MGKYDTLIRIAECKSLTQAANEIGYNQSSLTYIVNNMEEELGVKLFLRDRKGIELTDAGREIIEIMRKIEKLEQEMQDVSAFYNAGILKIAAFASIEIAWLPGVLKAFKKLHPDTKVVIGHLRRYFDLEPALKEGRFDCGFFVGKPQPGYEFIPLYKEDYYVVVGENSPLAEREDVTIRELAEYPLIPPSESKEPGEICDLVRKLWKYNGVQIEPEEDIVTITMVEHGFGISIFPKLLLNQLSKGKRVKAIPIRDHLQRTIGILCRSYDDATPLMKDFIRLAKEYINDWDEAESV